MYMKGRRNLNFYWLINLSSQYYSKLLPFVRSFASFEVVWRIILLRAFCFPFTLLSGSSSSYHCSSRFQQLQSLLHEGFAVSTKFAILILTQGIETTAESAFVCKGAGDLSLQVILSLTDNTCVVNETVFWRIFFRLQSTEKSFLCSQDLDRGCRCFCQVH